LTAVKTARTVQYLHAVLRKALNVAWKDQVTARNVAALVDPPRANAGATRQDRTGDLLITNPVLGFSAEVR